MLEKTAEENNLFLIQDTAQGFGSSVRGKRSGSFGDVSSTSFFPAKPLGVMVMVEQFLPIMKI